MKVSTLPVSPSTTTISDGALAGVVDAVRGAVDGDVLALAVHEDSPRHHHGGGIEAEHGVSSGWIHRLLHRRTFGAGFRRLSSLVPRVDEQLVRVEVDGETFRPVTDIERDLDEG